MSFNIKTLGIILTVCLVVGTSQAGHFRQLKAQIDELTNEVKALVQKKDPNTDWVKLNSAPVCFGAKDHQFGTFKASTGGNLMKIKLVHLYGYVACAGTAPKFWSHWGCGYYNQDGVEDWSVVSVTTAANTVLLPPKEINRGSFHWALIPGYSSRSPEFVMSIYDSPIAVTAGQELRVWYSEDLYDDATGDNYGRVCADVYGHFM